MARRTSRSWPRLRVLRTLAPVWLALAVVASAFPGLLTGRAAYFYGDVWRMQYPLAKFVSEQLRAGRLPLWWPFEGLGTSLPWASVAGLFHPTVLLHLAFPPWAVLQAEILLIVLLACVGAWKLSRELGAEPWAAAVSAVAFPLSGGMLGQIHTITYGWGAAYLPWTLIGAVWIARGRRLSGTLLAGASLALSGLAGDMQGAYYAAATAVVLVFGLTLRAGTSRVAPWVLVGLPLITFLLGAVQWMPALEALATSGRGDGLGWSAATWWSLDPLRLLDLFLGDLANWRPWSGGAAIPSSSWAQGAWVPTVTVGPVVLLGVVWALVLGKSRARVAWVLAGTATVLLALAMGRFGGIYRVFYEAVPLWSAFRFPEKLVPYATLLLVVLAARGLTDARSTQVAVFFVSSAALAGFLLAVGVGSTFLVPLIAENSWHVWASRLGGSALVGAGVVAVVAAAVLWKAAPGGGLWLGLPALLAAAQLAIVNGAVTRAGMAEPEVFAAPMYLADVLSALGGVGQGKARVTSEFSSDRLLEGGGAEQLPVPLRHALWQRAVLVSEHNSLAGIESMSRYLPATEGAYAELARGDLGRWFRLLMPLYGNAFLISSRADLQRVGPLPARLVFESERLGVVVLRYDDPLPRVFVASRLTVADEVAARRALAQPEVCSGHLTVVRSSHEGDEQVQEDAEGTVEVHHWTAHRIELLAKVRGSGILVINDAWAPGWEAWVDGLPVPILRANELVRGIPLGEGEHDVVLAYRGTPGLRAGVLVSAAAWGALGFGVALAVTRRRRVAPSR